MNIKKILTALILISLLSLTCLSIVSAEENVNDNIEVTGEVVKDTSEELNNIVLNSDGDVNLTKDYVLISELEITKNTIINGNNHTVTISPIYKLFDQKYNIKINKGVTLTLINVNLLIVNNDKTGIIIHNDGNLEIINSEIYSCGGISKGIENYGVLKIENSKIRGFQFYNNNFRGGAIANSGTLKINNSLFENNYSLKGGVISNDGTLEIYNSKFKNNKAEDGSGNDATGGAIYSTKDVYCYNCYFEGNIAEVGGAIQCKDANLKIDKCTFINNEAVNAYFQCKGGAVWCKDLECYNCVFENNCAYDYGGAIYTEGKTIIKNSVFKNNEAKDNHGGAICIWNGGDHIISDCKFENNKAKEHGASVYLDGHSSHVTIYHNTFYGEYAGSGKGEYVYTHGYYDKIERNYYYTANPNFRNHFYEHKNFGSDKKHSDSNPCKSIEEYNGVSTSSAQSSLNMHFIQTANVMVKSITSNVVNTIIKSTSVVAKNLNHIVDNTISNLPFVLNNVLRI